MAPLSSPDSSQSRFGGGLCCDSMAPTVPASGFGFDPRPHLQRLLQSSAARNEDSSFQIPEQVRQFYLAQNPEPASGHCSSEALRSSNSSAEIAVTDPHRDPIEVDQGFPSYRNAVVGGPAISPSLIRYHSAPSSVLANLAGMTNGVFHPNSELGQFLSSSIAADVKTALKELDTCRNHNLHHIEKQVSMAADRLAIHGNGFISAHSPYRQPSGGGEILSQLTMDADDVPLIRSPETLSEAGRTALQRPTSHDQNSRLIYSSKNSENGVQGVPPAKDGLLRHCSSPAGFLSQLSDEHERHMLASSSGNSSEEGNYERRGGDPGLFNGYAWDDAGNIAGGHVDASSAARKRIRDLAGKSCLRSTVLDSQKPDALESSFLGSYFGMPMTDSLENTYLTDKMSSDSTPCRTRAKRGCATHPRSIAERVRRTKISERMKKLQELVPHMDKQANTAEMLDEAVEYVKCLQRQVKVL